MLANAAVLSLDDVQKIAKAILHLDQCRELLGKALVAAKRPGRKPRRVQAQTAKTRRSAVARKAARSRWAARAEPGQPNAGPEHSE